MHISDLHCGKDPDVANFKSFYDSCPNTGQIGGFFRSLRHGVRQTTYNLEIGKKVARFLVEHSADQSLLIISGDLAASGIEDDLKVALAFIEGTPRSTQMFFVTSDVTPTIAVAELPVLIVPGNHDRFQDNYGKSGGTYFDAIFRVYWGDPNPSIRHRVIEDPATEVKLGFVSADFCLSSDSDATKPIHINRFGQGKVYQPVLDGLATRTTHLRKKYDGIGIVWVIHFPPCATDNEDPALELLDRSKVMSAAAANDIKLILAGHIHRPVLVQQQNVTVACAGTAAAYMSAEGYWIHKLEIAVENSAAFLAGRKNFAWNLEHLDFVLQSE
jgi:predicted phosphodiesterase